MYLIHCPRELLLIFAEFVALVHFTTLKMIEFL